MRHLSAVSFAIVTTFVGVRTAQAQNSDLDSILNSPSPPKSSQAPAAPQNAPAQLQSDAPKSTAVPPPAPASPVWPGSAAETAAAPTKKPAASFNGVTEEIIVTAQKREESIQNVDIAISAFGGDALKDLGIKNTADLTGLVPGFTYANSGYSVPIYTIRGVGFNETSQMASSTVGVYSDEVSLPYPAMTKGSDLDLQRVEVLKGPQGTLYGRNTTGGAVNYIANKPTDTFDAGATATYSSYETTDVEGHVSGPFSDDLKGRLAIRNTLQQQGWQYDYVNPGRSNGRQNNSAARGILEWSPEDDLEVRITADGWLEFSDPQFPQAFAHLNQAAIVGFAPSPAVVNFPLAPNDDARATSWDLGQDYYLHERFNNLAMRADWTLSPRTTFTTIAAVQNYKNDNHLDLDGMDAQEFEYYIDTRTNVASLEPRLAGTITDNTHYTAGAYFSGDTVSEKRDFFLQDNSTGDGGILFNRVKLEGFQSAKTAALFGQLEWQASDQFKFTLGLRGTSEGRQYNACARDVNGDIALAFTLLQAANRGGLGPVIGPLITNQQAAAILQFVNSKSPTNAEAAALGQVVQQLINLGGPVIDQIETLLGGPHRGGCVETAPNGFPSPTAKSLDESNLSWRAAVDWTPTDNSRFYVSSSLGYKSGSFPLVPTYNESALGPVKQERLLAYEAGFKVNFLDNRLKVDGAAFYYDYSDKQLFTFYDDPVFGPLNKLANVPKSEINGAELNMQYAITDGLYVSLGGSYLQSQVIRYEGVDSHGQPEDFKGNELAYTPPWSAMALINYEKPLTNTFGVNVGVDGHYQSKAYGELTDDPTFIQHEYYVLNAHLGLKTLDNQWALTAFVKNLTNEVYYVSLYRLSDDGVRYTGMPRTVGVTLAWNYR